MIILKFRFKEKMFYHPDDRTKDSVDNFTESINELGIEFDADPIKQLPLGTLRVAGNIFRSLCKFVPDFIKGKDLEWGSFGYCKTSSGKKIKIIESGTPVTHDCSLDVIEELQIEAYGVRKKDMPRGSPLKAKIIFEDHEVDLFIID